MVTDAAHAAAPAGDAGGATEVVAAIDQGTQSTRVFLFDAAGQSVASHQVALKQIYPKAGCASLKLREQMPLSHLCAAQSSCTPCKSQAALS